MARYFQGRYNLEKLSIGDQSRLLGALAALEDMGKAALIDFKTGVSRSLSNGKERTFRIQAQHVTLLNFLKDHQGQWISRKQIIEESGIKEGSIGSRLKDLENIGSVERKHAARTGGLGNTGSLWRFIKYPN
jgi:hypothetical protein